MARLVNIQASSITEITERICRCLFVMHYLWYVDILFRSANDVLFLEIQAGGTQFAAGDEVKSAFTTLIDGDRWMIFRNILTGVLQWDLVRF